MKKMQMEQSSPMNYGNIVWEQFKKRPLGLIALIMVLLFAFIGLYAPFLASSRPIVVSFEGHLYFPLLRYLFYTGYYSKPIDLFYNLLMFTLPLALLFGWIYRPWRKQVYICLFIVQVCLFIALSLYRVKDPAASPVLEMQQREALRAHKSELQDPLMADFIHLPTWEFNIKYQTPYAKLNLALKEQSYLSQHQQVVRDLASKSSLKLERVAQGAFDPGTIPTLWNLTRREQDQQAARYEQILKSEKENYSQAIKNYPILRLSYLAAKENYNNSTAFSKIDQATLQVNESDYQSIKMTFEANRKVIQRYLSAKEKLEYLRAKQRWILQAVGGLKNQINPLLRPFHWEEDAGGSQNLNQVVSWWHLTRINRKDLVSSLIFGIRVSLVVGVTAVAFALLIGLPVGAMAGYFGGKFDLFICRLMEIWEALPTFFMLLLVVAMTQSKSIFLVISVLGIFGWTGIARYIRGEVLKQRHLSYVEACCAMGLGTKRIIFNHILPNAIPPVITLLPFAIMAAIISEAGLSFLGLGEEGSSSWGVLMDEGRTAFPGESYLLWPPALLLTLLLISIAIVGDTLRDAIDPKLRV